jgi:hypothetical protein
MMWRYLLGKCLVGVVIRRLLDLTRWATAHCESAPCENSFMGLKGHELFGLLVERDCQKSMHGVQLEEVSLAVELFDFVCSQWERARHRLQAVIHKRIHRHSV